MTFNGLASVNWGAEVSGVDLLKQKVICCMMTRRGSDKLVPDRGTNLDANLMGAGAYDLLSIQHELNFAAVKTRRDINAAAPDAAPADALASFQMLMTGYSAGRPEVALRITNAAGTYAAPTTTL